MGVNNKANKENEVRSPEKAVRLGRIIGAIVRLFSKTLRYEYLGAVPENPKGVIYTVWHNKIMVVPGGYIKMFPDPNITVLTSASKDGAILEYTMRAFGFDAVRGSSSRRGARALIELKRRVKEGSNICITPDGPRGPRYKTQAGAVKLASLTGAPVIPVTVSVPNCWTLNTWDKFVIPVPFSKVSMHYGNSLSIERDLSDEDMESYQQQLTDLMLRDDYFNYE